MEKNIENFLTSPTEKNSFILLEELRYNDLHNITLLLYDVLSKLYPHNVSFICNAALAAFYIKEYELCYDLYSKALDFPNLSESQVLGLKNNRKFSIPHIQDNYITYPEKIIKNICNRRNTIPLITFSITTCKRFDLFEKTMNSFLQCCKDVYKIDKWLCVDDNSSEEDRKKMKDLYPFFTFYYKTVQEKGHPKSMNIIIDKLDTEFIFHMEDDWKFFEKRNYISECMEILSSDVSYGQCLINRNYTEVFDDNNVVGGEIKHTKKGLRYCLHEFANTNEEKQVFINKHGNERNSSYWPHYSFRPSLITKQVFTQVGKFNINAHHFEMEYSYRYNNLGFKSVFLDGIHCLHTGRLTSEIHDKTKKNAYDLNNESQFFKNDKQQDKQEDIEVFVINLNRRRDRIEKFVKNYPIKYTLFEAVDGKKLKPTALLQKIFENNKYNMNRGVIGCSLSHIKLLIKLVNSDKKAYLILEDDITFTDKFNDKFNAIIGNMNQHNWDLIYLGHHLTSDNRKDGWQNSSKIRIDKCDKKSSLRNSLGGNFGYLISKSGAEKILEYINTNGIETEIDNVFQNCSDELNVFYIYPHLVFTKSILYNNLIVDSDVHRDFVSLYKDINYETYTDRLKKNNKWNIDDVFSNNNDNNDSKNNDSNNNNDNGLKFSSCCINLNKREDRLNKFYKLCPIKFDRITAVDGNKIDNFTLDEKVLLRKLHNKNHVPGETGCKISHLRSWEYARHKQGCFIFEDDIEFEKDFVSRIKKLKLPEDCDIVYICGQWVSNYGPDVKTRFQGHFIDDERLEKFFIKTDYKGLYKMNLSHIKSTQLFNTPLFRCGGGYLVTPSGAKKLIDLANKQENDTFINNPLDTWILQVAHKNNLNIYDYFPHPAHQVWDPVTGDIRRGNFSKFIIDIYDQTNDQSISSKNKKIKKVKFLGPPKWWKNPEEMMKHYGVMCDDDMKWGDLQLTTDKKADVYVIINCPSPGDYYEENKTIIFQMEPNMDTRQNIWGKWSNPDKSKFFHINNHSSNLNAVQTEFKIPKEIDVSIKKDLVSSIQSYSYTDEGHKLRIDFLKYADKNCPELFNIFGRKNYHSFSNYIGTVDTKLKGIANYKYYFMAENNSYDNYATEKIWEPILCECLCFYWGCPNLESYIDELAFVRLDISDPKKSLNIVKTAIKENWWEKRYKHIINAKNAILNDIGMMPTISKLSSNIL